MRAEVHLISIKVSKADHITTSRIPEQKCTSRELSFQIPTLVGIFGMENRRKGFYGWFGVTQPTFDPDNRFVASPFLSPLALGIIRLVFATYMTACIIIEPILLRKSRRTRRDAVKFPAYFTNITFISMAW